MKIGLIDIDYNGSYPNLPLMKLSAYHKQQGDTVEWYNLMSGHFNTVYVAKVFSWSPDYQYPINADRVVKGGSGYAIKTIYGKEGYYPFRALKEIQRAGYEYMSMLPNDIEHIYPDYSLYPKLTADTAFGFLTRGCPRSCSFCHVAAKEGKKSVKVADLSEFWKGQKNIVLCDPNLLACKDWKDLLQQLIDSRAVVEFNQGLDVRMLTREKCEMLCQIRMKNPHFAWDRYEDKELVLPKFKMFAEYNYVGKNPDHHAIVYVLVNFDTTIEQDLDRIYTLRDLGYWAYVMIYDKEHCAPTYKKLQRWCNNRVIFAAEPDFRNYMKDKPADTDIITLPNGKQLTQTSLF